MIKILLVEDEESLADGLRMNLELEGYRVTWAKTGKEAIQRFHNERVDLVVLDWMLPEMDGLTVCQSIRLENTHTPILMLTAKNAVSDRVQGLRTGADDYLGKPFNLEELLLRVEGLLKRSKETATPAVNDVFVIGGCQVDMNAYQVTDRNGHQHPLSKREMMLLKLLFDKQNEVVSRELILETVWGYDVYPSTRSIDNYILNFRKLFEHNPKDPAYFHSVRGVGYKLTPTVE
jgi:two-component system, OmpR family, alkaline phosphatase synthesis response regulator PhoP